MQLQSEIKITRLKLFESFLSYYSSDNFIILYHKIHETKLHKTKLHKTKLHKTKLHKTKNA